MPMIWEEQTKPVGGEPDPRSATKQHVKITADGQPLVAADQQTSAGPSYTALKDLVDAAVLLKLTYSDRGALRVFVGSSPASAVEASLTVGTWDTVVREVQQAAIDAVKRLAAEVSTTDADGLRGMMRITR